MKRVAAGLAFLCALLAMNDADAQRRRMPVRTEPIPETETAAERAANKMKAPPENPSMMIYGPPTPVLGAPPAPPKSEPSAAPAPVATPPVAAPAPIVTPVTPIPTTPAPVAVPVPVPTPAPAAIAVPASAPTPPPVPVAIPAPAPEPVPLPAPLAIPAPAAPLVPAPPPVAPLAIPAPAAPAPATRPLAVIAPAPGPLAPPKLDAKLVEQIFSCLAPGLPQDWKRTWIVVTSAETATAAKFYVTTSYRDEDAEEFVPCNVQEITRRITGLNDALPPEQRRWKSARLAIDSEGEYELKYDYAR